MYVNGDRTRLAQVFANLLNNSHKYSEPGQPITITSAREGGDAVVRVRDTGMGIHPEMLPRKGPPPISAAPTPVPKGKGRR